jgi:hypothetical protein
MVNRLKGQLCYEAGMIDDVSIEEATTWRDDITIFLKEMNVGVIDPTKKPLKDSFPELESKEFRKKMKEEGRYNELAALFKKHIRQPDLRACDKADFLIAYLDLSKVICGTWEEIFECNRAKKPVLVVVKQGKINCPDWLIATIEPSHIFSSFDELKIYLRFVNEAEYTIPESYGRWVWFDYADIFRGTDINYSGDK